MKATDYFEKWAENIKETIVIDNQKEEATLLRNIIVDFNEETQTIINAKKISKNDSLIALLKEQNQKYNKFCRLVNEYIESNYLLENGYKNFWLNHMPLLKNLWI